jgi:hypothetical protein
MKRSQAITARDEGSTFAFAKVEARWRRANCASNARTNEPSPQHGSANVLTPCRCGRVEIVRLTLELFVVALGHKLGVTQPSCPG